MTTRRLPSTGLAHVGSSESTRPSLVKDALRASLSCSHPRGGVRRMPTPRSSKLESREEGTPPLAALPAGGTPCEARASPALARPATSQAVSQRRVLTPNAAVPAAHGTPTFGAKRQRGESTPTLPSRVGESPFAGSLLKEAPQATPAQETPPRHTRSRRRMLTPNAAVPAAHGTPVFCDKRRWAESIPSMHAAAGEVTSAFSRLEEASLSTPSQHQAGGVIPPNAAVAPAQGSPTFNGKRRRGEETANDSPSVGSKATRAQEAGSRRRLLTPNAAVPAAHGTPAFGAKRQREEASPCLPAAVPEEELPPRTSLLNQRCL
ncbi:MAG: hypothetical protein SGPRY_011873 [Prymnesium sp.]